ncbi:MAG: PIN domain-containing protein [Micropruina sp.]|uniref:PIN domain-containing protein n=1 Tax=Micropruina sp. TaxID=2737536 RepID=UPI0039E618AA
MAIPLLLLSHHAHRQVSEWASDRTLHLSGHAAIESYSVLTRLPGDARLQPADAVTLLDATFGDPLVLSGAAAREAHRELALRGVAGGASYDALVALAARAHDVVLATRDARALPTYQALGVQAELIAE